MGNDNRLAQRTREAIAKDVSDHTSIIGAAVAAAADAAVGLEHPVVSDGSVIAVIAILQAAYTALGAATATDNKFYLITNAATHPVLKFNTITFTAT